MLKVYEGVSKIFRIGHLEGELQMVQFPATRFSCVAILRVTFVLVLNKCLLLLFISLVRELLDTPSYISCKIMNRVPFLCTF